LSLAHRQSIGAIQITIAEPVHRAWSDGVAIADGTSVATLAPMGAGTTWPPPLCAITLTLIQHSKTAAGIKLVFFIEHSDRYLLSLANAFRIQFA
jgi:hypothetical protein